MRKAVSDKPGLPHVTFSDETHGDAVVYFPGEPVLHTGDLGVTPGAPFCGTAGGAEDAVKRLDLKDLGLSATGVFERGMPGMCKEAAQ